MKMIALVAALFSIGVMARPNTFNMTCSQAQSLVEREGAIVLSVGKQGQFDRFVSGSSYCESGERAYTSRVRTSNNASCGLKTCDDGRSGSGRTITGTVRSCRDGQTAIFTEPSLSGRGDITVVRTCRNGRYYPVVAQPTPRRCKEGRRSITTEPSLSGRGDITVITVCRNGRYVPVN